MNARTLYVQAMVQDDILCLVLGHPLVHYFLYEPRSITYAAIASSGASSTTSFSSPEVLRRSPGGRSVFSVRYRCLCEIIASGSTEGTFVAHAIKPFGGLNVTFVYRFGTYI